MLSKTFSADRGNAQWFCLILLVAASISASLVFACATPFAAFAVIAAALLPLRRALLTVGAAWLVNQALGFGYLGYPWTPNAAVWGLVIGVGAVIATVVAAMVFERLARIGRFAIYPIALVASFAVYELALLAATPVLGGAEARSLSQMPSGSPVSWPCASSRACSTEPRIAKPPGDRATGLDRLPHHGHDLIAAPGLGNVAGGREGEVIALHQHFVG
jgi:hypothetical protein